MSAGFQHPFLSSPRSSEQGKVVSAREAVRLIRPGDTVATGGFVGIGFAEEIALKPITCRRASSPRCSGTSPPIVQRIFRRSA